MRFNWAGKEVPKCGRLNGCLSAVFGPMVRWPSRCNERRVRAPIGAVPMACVAGRGAVGRAESEGDARWLVRAGGDGFFRKPPRQPTQWAAYLFCSLAARSTAAALQMIDERSPLCSGRPLVCSGPLRRCVAADVASANGTKAAQQKCTHAIAHRFVCQPTPSASLGRLSHLAVSSS